MNHKSFKSITLCLIFVIPLLSSCIDDMRKAKRLDGEWLSEYVTSFETGEKDSTVQNITFTYDADATDDDGTFVEKRDCKTNTIEDEGYRYTVHYTSSISGRYEVLAGDLYMKYDLNSLELSLGQNDVSITPSSLSAAYGMITMAMSLVNIRQTLAESCRKEVYQNLFNMYKLNSSDDTSYQNLDVTFRKMSYDTTDGKIEFYNTLYGKDD